MIKVTVLPDSTRLITWAAKAGGREAGSMRAQTAWFHTIGRDGTPSPFPEKAEVILDRATDSRPEQPSYAPGEYTLHPSAVYIDQNGRLALSPRLTPIKQRTPA